MKYKLIENSLNDTNNIKKTILLNRGINDWKSYINLNEDCICDFTLLDNIEKAVECFVKHIENKSNIHIIVDSDVDGYTSASMVYRYIKHINQDINITYSLHTKKQHGISRDITIPDDCQFLIIPDAGSNDFGQCKELSSKGIDILILDHHICDNKMNSDWAIVVNNQNGNYPNKNFCGAGVTYKFLKAVDEELWEDYADNLLDMVALGNISDVMDMREFETRYYTDFGLRHINSKLFKALVEKQSFPMKDKVNITTVQFYITPILNALIRIGNGDEKELLFRAFIETDEIFKYKKRGETEEVDEDIYTRVARLCGNAKSRQDKEVLKGVDEINNLIINDNLDNNKVLFVNVSDILSETLTGLVAIKIAEQYNKPCLLLRKRTGNDNMCYGGSCRNFDNSPIDSLKEFLESTKMFNYVRGHDNAAGVSIQEENIKQAIKMCNKILKEVDFQKCFNVDFEIDYSDFSISIIKDINDIKYLFGQGIKEPLICLNNIEVYQENIRVMGKNLNCWKITDDMGFEIVNFGVDTDKDPLLCAFRTNKEKEGLLGTIDMVGKVDISEYKGILTPQFIIKDYVLKRKERE